MRFYSLKSEGLFTQSSDLPTVFVRKSGAMTAYGCGMIDSSVWIAFMLSTDPIIYYTISFILKIGLFLLSLSTVSIPQLWRFALFIVPILFVSCTHLLFSESELYGGVTVFGFAISIALTLILIVKENVNRYMRTISTSIFIGTIIYIYFVMGGGVDDTFGRWSYFNNSSPNLGGEIIYTGTLATALGWRKLSVLTLAIFATSIYAITLLQARAALIASCIVILYVMYYQCAGVWKRYARIAIIGLAIVLLAAFFLTDEVYNALDLALLINDTYRGGDTGFVGRSERWENAIKIFFENPIIGVGFGFFRDETNADITPHNFWLRMISEMGLISLISFSAIYYSVKLAWRENMQLIFVLSSALIMTTFNDRSINMNPYPFLILVVLFWPRSVWSKL